MTVRKNKTQGRPAPERAKPDQHPRLHTRYEALVALLDYRKRYGDCCVPYHWPHDPWLGKWVARMRAARKEKRLTELQVRELDQIGFTWSIDRQHSWEERFKELKSFKQAHGHCNVPAIYPPNPALGRWVANVRHAKKAGTLTEDKVHRLDALGFCWEREPIITSKWKKHLDELKAFKREHGHCNVPRQHGSNSPLGNWVDSIRHRKKEGRLDEEIIRCLNALGFSWVRKTGWKQRIHDLKAFKKEHGHCNVPWEYPPNPGLGRWVSKLRERKKHGELAQDRVLLLDALGFCWVRKRLGVPVSWEQHINDLKAFKKKHGHCNVPWQYQPNPSLANWVANIRKAKKHGRLDGDKIRVLDALGFCWDRIRLGRQGR